MDKEIDSGMNNTQMGGQIQRLSTRSVTMNNDQPSSHNKQVQRQPYSYREALELMKPEAMDSTVW
jgi:hypothetical protein